jgi:hypothetical protein
MDALEEATAVLRSAEQQLRSILVKSAEEGNYDHLPRIAEWAKFLSATLGGQPVTGLTAFQPKTILQHPPENGVHERAAGGVDSPPAVPTPKVITGRRKKGRRGKAAKDGYPQFVREGDSLVKIGWSKSEGKTYEHKAPRGVLRALVQALVRSGSGGARFTVEALLPLKEIAGGSDIPDYQTYLTLAWLRSAGLVIQHGRQGYSLPPGSDLERESERRWGELRTR